MVFLCVCMCLLAAVNYVCFGRKLFAVFQQSSYRLREFFSSLVSDCKKEIERLSTYSLVFLIYSLFFSPIFVINETLYAAVLLSAALSLDIVVFVKNEPVKEVKLTKRFIRMTVVSVLLATAVAAATGYLGYLLAGNTLPICLVVSLTLAILCGLTPVLIVAGYLVMYPYDKALYKISVGKCKKELAKRKDLIKIGVTGSYGKTSVKNILEKMLSAKYKVVATPLSYNTPLGICRSVKKLTPSAEIFIAEMGARRVGDIKELCEIVRPDVGVITGICGQHLETFKTLENVKKAKNELIEALPLDGAAFFNTDGKEAAELFEKCPITKFSAGISGGDVYAKIIREEKNGTYADIVLGGKEYSFVTKLRGRHNVSNICLAAEVAFRLGVPPERIIAEAVRLKPVPHRLEVKNAGGITIIDDSYNANIEGVKAAAEVLGSFGGKRFVITPGMVECGKNGVELNETVGEILSAVADVIIAVGNNARDIANGAAYRREVIKTENLEEATEKLKPRLKTGDVVLFLNDLPDKYGI